MPVGSVYLTCKIVLVKMIGVQAALVLLEQDGIYLMNLSLQGNSHDALLGLQKAVR